MMIRRRAEGGRSWLFVLFVLPKSGLGRLISRDLSRLVPELLPNLPNDANDNGRGVF
jgi:hypothetical protein